MNYWLLSIPVISAIIGWAITRLAITFLFRPYYPIKIFGFTLQGIIPKRQQQLAEKIGEQASSAFYSFVDIEQKISDPDNLREIMPVIEKHVDDFLRNKLTKEMPFLSMFIGDKTIGTMKKVFMQEIETLFPE